MTYEEFYPVVKVLMSAKPAMKLSEDDVDFWFTICEPIPVLEFRVAVTKAVMREGFVDLSVILADCPTGRLIQSKLAPESSVSVDAVTAWVAVLGAIRKHGQSATVDFDDDRVHAAVSAMGGWRTICSGSTETKWLRKEFLETFKLVSGELAETRPQIGTGRERQPVLIECGTGRVDRMVARRLSSGDKRIEPVVQSTYEAFRLPNDHPLAESVSKVARSRKKDQSRREAGYRTSVDAARAKMIEELSVDVE